MGAETSGTSQRDGGVSRPADAITIDLANEIDLDDGIGLISDTERSAAPHEPKVSGLSDPAGSVHQGNWRRTAAIALAASLAMAAAVAIFAQVATPSPTATVSVILNDNSVNWPFYAAAQEKAQTRFDDPAAFAQASAALSVPANALEIEVNQPGDLSLLEISAVATDDESALALASSAAEILVIESLAEQRQDSEEKLARQQARELELTEAIDDALLTVNGAASAVESAPAAARLEVLSSELGALEGAMRDTTEALASTESEYQIVGRPALVDRTSETAVGALGAGVAAGLICLLVLSCFGGKPASTTE